MSESSKYNLVFLLRICLNVILIAFGFQCIPVNFKVNMLLLAPVEWNIMCKKASKGWSEISLVHGNTFCGEEADQKKSVKVCLCMFDRYGHFERPNQYASNRLYLFYLLWGNTLY